MEDGHPPLMAKDLAELALFLYDSGDAAFQQGNLLQAGSWFAQSLSVFSQLQAKNAIWIAALMLSLGKIALATGQIEPARIFGEACANICAQLPEDEVVKDYRQDLSRLFAQVDRNRTTSKMFPSHEFVIAAGELSRRKVRITIEGEIIWTMLAEEGNAQPIELGLRTVWKVIPLS